MNGVRGTCIAFAAALVSMAWVPSASWAQQAPASAQPAAEEGFFRPADDPSLTRVPNQPDTVSTLARRSAASPPAVDVRALEAQVIAREAAERELERAARDHRQAQAAAAVERPIIVWPLEGTAPIASPLDGTAPILSPIGR